MYIKDNLILDFDISDSNSFNISDFTVKSKSKWNGIKLTNTILDDYGLTQYDVGKTESLIESKSFNTNNDKFLKLERIAISDQIGNKSTFEYGIDLIQNNIYGRYAFSKGGYFNNPFKFHNYDIEYLPRQFKNGFTFETTLYIDKYTFAYTNNNSNIFLYLGIRAEDKFGNTTQGNKKYITSTGSSLEDSYYIYDIFKLEENKQNIDKVITFLKTEDVFIKTNDQIEFTLKNLDSDVFILVLNRSKLIPNVDYTFDLRSKKLSLKNGVNVNDSLIINHYKLVDDIELVNIDLSKIENKDNSTDFGIDNNVIAFKFNNSRKIGYRKVDQNYQISEKYSDLSVEYTKWIHVTITYDPYEKIIQNNIDDDCPIIPRMGLLKIYVNGMLYLEDPEFIEPAFKALPIDKSKQIGVPYNISWPGGSFGLKHSYNFNEDDNDYPYVKNTVNDSLTIEDNFDGYFKGGFQKLRLYDKCFDLNEIRKNFEYESKYYRIPYGKGGRLIFTPVPNPQNDYLLFLNGVWDDSTQWNDNNVWNG
jgi:hypothetical protein